MTSAIEDIWTFALRLYSQPGMIAACMNFEKQHDADCDVVMFLLHHAQSEKFLSVSSIEEAERAAETWRNNVIWPLRRLNRGLKTAPAAYAQAPTLLKTITEAEIEAGRMQLNRLAALNLRTVAASSPQEAALISLAAYCTVLDVPADAAGELLIVFKQVCANEMLG